MKQFFLLLLVFNSMNEIAQTTNLKKQAMTTNIIFNKGDQLYSTIYQNPNKETIILLHGGPAFPDDLKEVVEILKDNFQIITFHQRGTKKSPCLSNDFSINAYVSDIEVVAMYYKITKFHLWGHSWGGLYAQIYADKHSENLLSLFLCCPGSGTNIQWKQTEKEVMQYNKAKCTAWQWSKMGMNSLFGKFGNNNAYKQLFKQVLKNYNDDFVKTDNINVNFDNLKAQPINKTRPEIMKYPILKRQENPSFKITILYGDQDIYKSSKEFVINRFPTANILMINNCGHIPWLHNPTKFNEILKQHYK
jgi:proline iminopeptidase